MEQNDNNRTDLTRLWKCYWSIVSPVSLIISMQYWVIRFTSFRTVRGFKTRHAPQMVAFNYAF